jgi:SAM-dependent methyltransferase
MREHALAVFVCPACKEELRLNAVATRRDDIITGDLTCPSCGSSYPIVRSVPRFVGSGEYASSFGRQWTWFRTVQLDSANGSSESETALRETTGWTRRDLEGRRVLDAGVGAGRFAECAAASGAEVYGIDLTAAVDAAHLNLGHRQNVHLAQADIFALPFRPDTFDRAYSIGVLHHTPDPADAFRRVAATVKPDGELAVYVYARYGLAHQSSDLIRRVTTRLPNGVMLALSSAAVPLYPLYRIPGVGKLLKLVLPISTLPDWRWRWLDTFDWYTPTYQWKYLYPEVFRWFEQNGFRDVKLFDGPIRMRGMKSQVAGR